MGTDIGSLATGLDLDLLGPELASHPLAMLVVSEVAGVRKHLARVEHKQAALIDNVQQQGRLLQRVLALLGDRSQGAGLRNRGVDGSQQRHR